MKAMILAAGEGTRLRPLTLEMPKTLLPVGGKPLIEYILTWLKSHGVKEVAINLYHLGHKIREYLGDGSRYGVKIIYSEEERLLGTAGGAKRIACLFSSDLLPPDIPFVVVYGDNLTNFNLSEMIEFHKEKKAIATLALFNLLSSKSYISNPREVGIVQINDEGQILSFVEKPQSLSSTPQSPPLASGGVYVLGKEVINYIPDEGSPDFAYDVFPKLIEQGFPIYGYVLEPGAYLLDIGTPEKYQKTQEIVHQFKVER